MNYYKLVKHDPRDHKWVKMQRGFKCLFFWFPLGKPVWGFIDDFELVKGNIFKR